MNVWERARVDSAKVLECLKKEPGTIPDLAKRANLSLKAAKTAVYREVKKGTIIKMVREGKSEGKSKHFAYQIVPQQEGVGTGVGIGKPMSDAEFRLGFRKVMAEVDRRLVEFESLKKRLRAMGGT